MLLDKMPLQRWMQHERQNRNDNVEVDGGRSLGGRHLEDGGGEM